MTKKYIYRNSLAFKDPNLAKEWNLEKNGLLTSEEVTSGSHKKIWWRCKKGHEWEAIVKNRSSGSGCPYCSGRRVIKGETDLEAVNPNLAKEWHPSKNENLKPCEVTNKSGKKVWWQCTKGHEWMAAVADRSNGRGCPYCSGHKVIKGETDLETINTDLAKEWHPTKNSNLKPDEISSMSNRKVWWQCSKGHEWESVVGSRSAGSSCPYCSGHKVIKGETDLETMNPDLVKEWNLTKNGNLKADAVSAKSNKKVWWQCSKGHEWEAIVGSRSCGSNCPYCSGHKVIKGETDLEAVNPYLAKEWHPTKNGNLKANAVSVKSHMKVWWYCKKGHEWEAIVGNRSTGRGCPYCSGHKVIKGETDLETVNPNLVKEWHPQKNSSFKPCEVSYKSDKRVWWQCVNGHEWEATVGNRSTGSGCPYCSGMKAIKGKTDLETVNPSLAKEWHPTRNGNLKPDIISAKSHKKIWWQCFKGHEWVAAVGDRSIGSGCPYCSGKKAIKGETDLETLNPELAKEWHNNKNINLNPSEVTKSSNKKVWWQCENGHEWRTAIIDRNHGTGCPACNNRKLHK